MPFVIRDANGAITGIYNQAVEGGEEVAVDDPALQAFIQATAPLDQEKADEWLRSDLAMTRVMEDLIDILMEKNVVNITDFPDGAQRKLITRRGKRSEMLYVTSLFEGIDDEFDGGGYL